MNYGQGIRAWRKQKGWTQDELAEKVNMSVNAISLMERGETDPHKSTLEAMALAFEIPISYLIYFAIDEEDVPEEKRPAYKHLDQAIRNLLLAEPHPSK